MHNITDLFEQEVLKKIKAKNDLDKKLETSRLGFNRGVSYLENIWNDLQKHIPSLDCELKINVESNSSGHFIFVANHCRIVIQVWGVYGKDGSSRAGCFEDGKDFTLFYKNYYFTGGAQFEKELVSEIVSKFDVVQVS